MRLKELRQRNKLTQVELAKALSIGVVTYNRYELGLREPDIETMKILANYFHVSVDYLIGNEQPNKLDMTSLSDTKRKCIEDIQKMSDAEVEAISHYIDGMLGREFYKKETI